MNFLTNVSYASLEKFASSGLKFFIVFIVATSMGPVGQGEYSFLLTFWSSCYFFFSFGLDMATNYYSSKKSEVLPQLLGNGIMAAGLLSLIPIFGALAMEGNTDYFDELHDTFPALLAGLVVTFFGNTQKSTLYGRGEFKVVFYASMVHHLLVLGGLIVFYFMDSITIRVTMILWLIGVSAGTLICLIRNLALTSFKVGLDFGLIRELAGYGRNVYLISVLNSLNLRFDAFLIMYFLDLEELGYYNLAVVFMEVILYVPSAATRVILTEVSSKNTMDPNVFRNLSGITLLFLVVVGVATPIGILLFFPAFTKSIYLFLVLLPCGFLMGMSYVMCFYLLGKDLSHIPAKCSMVACAMTIGGNVILLPLIGIYGAAISTYLSYQTYYLLLYRAVNRLEPIRMMPRFDWVIKGARMAINKGRGFLRR